MTDPATRRLLAVARGDEPADLLLANARVVDVIGLTVLEADVAVAGGRIAGLGTRRAREVVDLGGAYLAPGFVDAHLHVESSMVPPRELARAVLPCGTTTLVADPHEIANVMGLAGVGFMLGDAREALARYAVMAPSCVPASPLATNGATLGPAELLALRDEPGVLGLAEVMSYPAVVAGDEVVLEKIALFAGRPRDGHAPGLTGADLAAYAAAGIGSDHECTTVEEAREKLRVGLTVFLREATNARNLADLLPLVDATTWRRLAFCTDDRTPSHLLAEGHVDGMVRSAIAGGVEPLVALAMASATAAAYFGLADRGAVLPGRLADLVVFDDLGAPRPRLVFVGGRLVAREGEVLEPRRDWADQELAALRGTVRVAWDRVDWGMPPGTGQARVIGLVPDQLVTRTLVDEPARSGDRVVSDPGRDLLRIAVLERHRGTGRVGHGLVRGFGLRRGALASTVAHDHHNLIVVGVEEASLVTAARRAAELGGGLVVAVGEQVVAEVPLPLAGLMSDRPLGEVAASLDRAVAAARELGSPLVDPFMALSFVGLEVIPELKITDQGLVDVTRFERVPLWVGG